MATPLAQASRPSVALPRASYRAAETLAFDVRMAAFPGYLHVAYLQADGSVVTLAIGAVAAHFALTAEVRQIHARLDETNVRIDETNARIGHVHNTLAARIDAVNDGTNAKFDRLFALLERSLQDHGRRLDAIERRLTETVPPSGAGATP